MSKCLNEWDKFYPVRIEFCCERNKKSRVHVPPSSKNQTADLTHRCSKSKEILFYTKF